MLLTSSPDTTPQQRRHDIVSRGLDVILRDLHNATMVMTTLGEFDGNEENNPVPDDAPSHLFEADTDSNDEIDDAKESSPDKAADK